MVYSKTELFTDELQEQAKIFKALAHPARLAILQYLAQIKCCMTGDISDEIPLSRTTVNQHLKELKDAGLIHGTTQGAKTNYCLNPEIIRRVGNIQQKFFTNLESDNLCC
jgi:ArsR family transcriptional regulator, arsenate/arsenite/antimonite-responsive transcriptional repressor